MAAFMGESCRRYDARVVADVSISIGTQTGRGNLESNACDITSDIAVVPWRFARPRTGHPGLHFCFVRYFRFTLFSYLGDSSRVSTSKGRRWNACGAAAEIETIGSLPHGSRAVNCLALAAGNSNKTANFAVNC